MVKHILQKTVNGNKVNYDVGEKFPKLTLNFSFEVASVCSNFKQTPRSQVAFSPSWVVSQDGLSAYTEDFVMDVDPTTYSSDVTAIKPDGTKVPIYDLVISLNDSSC